jgi:uncharacterized membrane protein HdeD (DUF308 family)
MSDQPQAETTGVAAGVGAMPGLEGLGRNWGWFVALGVLLIIVGTMAIGASMMATLATVLVFGTLLLIGGGMQVVGAFFSRQWRGFFLGVLTGLLYLIVGMLMVSNPLEAAAGLTLVAAVFLMIGGTVRIVVALSERFESWGWVLLHGVITAALGVLIWRQWPVSGLWAIGLFVGIEMLFSGWSWLMLGLCGRRLCRQ